MNDLDLTREAPRLDPIPFIVADCILLGFAGFIGWQAPAPLGVGPLAAISALVALGAIAGLYPFVVNHTRRQEEALIERTAQIEALARTLGGAAEQVSIAVTNLPAIAENSARQLKLAEQLPADIQAQIAALQQQLSATHAEENTSLRHELDTVRNAQTDKLATALADLTRLEVLAAKHSTALDGAIAHLPKLAEAFSQQTAETLRRETAAAVAALRAAANEASIALAAATTEARSAFDRGVRDAVSHLATQATSTPPFPAHTAQQSAVIVSPKPIAPPEPKPEPIAQTTPSPAAPETIEPSAATASPELIDDVDLDEPEAPAPTPVAAEPVVAAQSEPAESEITSEPETESEADSDTEADSDSATEPEAEPETEADNSEVSAASLPASDADSDSGSEGDADDDDVSSSNEPAPEAVAEPALSHDGFTRLVATAYIGIGNKLFIRGDGPGLRRDKGVPLQFISIGKWRWESAELLFPAQIRLYKNDQVECTAIGEITLEPGHHHEVNAQF